MNHRQSIALLSLCLGTTTSSLHAGDSATLATESLKSQSVLVPSAVGAIYRISAGSVYRQFGGVSFRTTGVSDRSALFDNSNNTAVANAGSTSSIADRQYDNGYVKKDTATGTADNLTWNWGYNTASQVRGDALSYNSNLGYSEKSGSSSWDSKDNSWTPYLEFVALFPVTPDIRFGPQFSVSYASISNSKSGLQTISGQQQSLQDTYALNGVVPPAAPYSGTFEGPGPLIDNIPSNRQTIGTGQIAFNQIADSLDLQLTTLTLGFAGDYRFFHRLHLTSLAGGTLNFSQLQASQQETLFTQASGGSPKSTNKYESSTDDSTILIGFTAQFGANFDVMEHWSLGVFGRYDWLADVKGSVGPSTYSVDLTGWSGGVVASYLYW